MDGGHFDAVDDEAAARTFERERFDVLHYHEPFVPFLSLVVLRQSTSVNIATFHAYAGFSPAMELGKRTLTPYAARLHGRIAVSALSFSSGPSSTNRCPISPHATSSARSERSHRANRLG